MNHYTFNSKPNDDFTNITPIAAQLIVEKGVLYITDVDTEYALRIDSAGDLADALAEYLDDHCAPE
jgi:hypothetical protein